MKKSVKWLSALALMIVCAFAFTACGSDGDDDDGGNGGDQTSVDGVSIIGTWLNYYTSNDPDRGTVFDSVTFNSDHTGVLIEEVGYGSDTPQTFVWRLSGKKLYINYSSSGSANVNEFTITVIDKNTIALVNSYGYGSRAERQVLK